MIKFLNLRNYIRTLDPVTTTDFLTREGAWHDEGLFSEKIFGADGTMDRKNKQSYINLNAKVIHPSALKVLHQLDQKIKKFISTEASFSLDKNGVLIEDPKGVTGIKEFIKIFPKIKFRGETKTREKYIKLLEEAYENELLFIQYLPVIPPDFRPAYRDERNQLVIDKLNEVYLTVIRRAFQMKSSGSGPLYDLLNFGLQSAVIDHDNYIRLKLQKKQGLIRQQILGKRIDFSGRAVITPDPILKINEIGIPFRIAVAIFEPFVIFQLLHSGKTDKAELQKEIKGYTNIDLSIETIHSIFKSIKQGDKIPDGLYNIFFEATKLAMEGRVVLAKRDPVLQAESYRGFNPILTKGDTITICNLQVGGFNADFDGDQMAIYHPLSDEAQDEVKQKLMRVETGISSNSINFGLSKEMWVGLYILTKNVGIKNSALEITNDDMSSIKDPYITVKYRGKITTAGKAIFNSCFPQDYPFIFDQSTKKLISKEILNIITKYSSDVAREVTYKLEQVAFKWATIIAPSISIKNLILPKEIMDLKIILNKSTSIEEADKIIASAKSKIEIFLKDTGFGDIVESDAAKGWDQPTQILFAKGIISDPTGEKLSVIKGSFSDGLSNVDFFDAASGARKGIMDRVLNTADTGYMSRKLAYLLNTVEVDRQLINCNTKRTLDLKMDSDLANRLTGRFVIKNGKTQEFDKSMYKDGDTIRLKSPVFCESPKLCHTCYGRLIERHRSPYVGIIAAQIIGERGTQLIMRTFHTGGAVTIIKKNIINDIISNDPLVTKDIVIKNLSQKENQLIAENDCSLLLDLTDDYTENENLIIDEEKGTIWVKSIISKIEFKDSFFNLILDYPCEIEIKEMNKVNKESIRLNFKSREMILIASLEAAELKGQILYVERLISGRELVKDPSHLFRKLMRVYAPTSSIDAVHLEVLVSQCQRYREDPRFPARLGKVWDPITINMKQVIFNEGFIQGLAFENINNAISQGLIGEDKPENSVLEKLLLGTLVTKEKRK